MTIQQAMREGAARLSAAGIVGAARDARWLMAAALGIEPDRLAARMADTVGAEAHAAFDTYVGQRVARQPVAQILGFREFYGLRFEVTPDVLDPRPETEALVGWAIGGPVPDRVLDLGTGSGAIVVALLHALPGTRGLATDISGAALDIARRNAASHGVLDRLTLAQASWWDGAPGRFDLIVGNPPYIAGRDRNRLDPEVRDWEPSVALFGGDDGLDAYRRIAPGLGAHLAKGGRAAFEFGEGQGPRVAEIFAAHFSGSLSLEPDLTGRARFLAARA